MKLRMIILIFAFVAFISGCTNKEKDGSKVTAENIIQSIQAVVPEYISEGLSDDRAIGDVKPYILSIANSNGGDRRNSDYIKIFIFSSEKTMKQKTKNLTIDSDLMTAVKTYEIKNALVMHFCTPWGNLEKNGEKIQLAMQKL